MMLATTDDYDYPHIDWHCKECGMVYCYAGYPPETRCIDGHGAGWKPEDDQIEEYIGFLESLEPGDGIVICGRGPAPLMGPVESVEEGRLTTVSINSPSRVVRWSREELTIAFAKAGEDYLSWSDVHHVESVPIKTAESDGIMTDGGCSLDANTDRQLGPEGDGCR